MSAHFVPKLTPEQRNNRLNTLIARLDTLRSSLGLLRTDMCIAADLASMILGALRFDDPERLAADIETALKDVPPWRPE